MRYAMIMAGGAGTRLWPMSRNTQPKQLLPLVRRAGAAPGSPAISLLEMSAGRLDGLVPPERRYICTGEQYRSAVLASLPAFSEAQILGEPAARDTVNAVGFTAAVLAKLDKDAIFAVLTADHVIEPEDTFRQRVELGFRLVEADERRLVTFSIKPTYPATGFGYVERGAAITGVKGADGFAYRVARYVEKPNIQRAQAYVESGLFSWNAGMFVWKASTVLDCIKRFKPESYQGLMKIQAAWGTKDQARVLAEVYPTLPKISIDYAVMEPASQDKQVQVCTVLTDVKWLDVGSWPSYGETLPADAAGNRLGGSSTPETTIVVQGKNNLVCSADAGHTVALLGCENLIVVHTKDATLVMPREKAEELKLVHGALREDLK
ncbi:MAG: mannose-1-phosphate guanylyltransferase [bacterium]